MIMARKTYHDKFKKQIVALFQSGKSIKELIAKYGVSIAIFYKWTNKLDNAD